jgi:hypothetical protein
MLIIRETFTAKPGQAGKLAKLFRRAMPKDMRVMTDVVGEYNTVVLEMEAESLADYEKQMKVDHMKDVDAQTQEELKHYADMYLAGKREIFKIVE